ncbi:diguanylate cyclase [Kineococcus sp. GCM10028916]|uniref:GGDEF domain-containing protein n=1 Tax=Kineococcus sp. GCM10028916 TaxID=3273394 RepID=UPI0036346936
MRTVTWTGALVRSLSARNPRSARVWAAIALMTTIVTCLVAGAATMGGLHAAKTVALLGLGAVSAVLLGLPAERAAPLVVIAPLAGVGVVVWLDLLSQDAGVTGQVFFVVPVVWAAAQLRFAGAALVMVATLAGEAVVVFTFLPVDQAVTDYAYLTVLLLLVGGVLTRSGATQERLVEQLRVQASVDPLTGLVTRRVLDSATEAAVRATGNTALVVIDLDRFKAVNDTFGHLGGDAALAHVANLLTDCCRDGDVVARMGGDELAVLMLDCTAETAARRAQAFVDVVRRTPLQLPGGVVVPLSISAGLSSMTLGVTRAEDLYARADSALYEAKRAGRDRLAHAA